MGATEAVTPVTTGVLVVTVEVVTEGLLTLTLQRVQNSAARLIFNLRQRDHVTPAPQQLHWLPIQARVQFKLCVLMYGIHNRQCPA